MSRLERLEDEFSKGYSEVSPPELRTYISTALESSLKTPSLLCFLSSDVAGSQIDIEEVAGLQYIHTGLCITREVVNNEGSWNEVGVEPVGEDMKLLAADVLVTLGFDNFLDYYDRATTIVNSFGTSKAKMRQDCDLLECEVQPYLECYRTAVHVGMDTEENQSQKELYDFAENLAYLDCIEGSNLIQDDGLTEKYRAKARDSADGLLNPDHERHFDRIYNETDSRASVGGD